MFAGIYHINNFHILPLFKNSKCLILSKATNIVFHFVQNLLIILLKRRKWKFEMHYIVLIPSASIKLLFVILYF